MRSRLIVVAALLLLSVSGSSAQRVSALDCSWWDSTCQALQDAKQSQ